MSYSWKGKLLENSATVLNDKKRKKPARAEEDRGTPTGGNETQGHHRRDHYRELGAQKKDWKLRGGKMTSMLYEVSRIIDTNVNWSKFPVTRIFRILGISRVWYYRQLDLPPILDKRINLFKGRMKGSGSCSTGTTTQR